MLKSLAISTLLLLAATALPAAAADATRPVKTVMDLTAAAWSGEGDGGKDIFSADLLAQLYSKDFAERYRAAAKFPAYDGGDSPFDYDVITNGQDGCPLEQVTITAEPQKGRITTVVARFNNTSCFGSEPEYQKLQEARFDVIEEGGRPVIDDIHTALGDNEFGSLKADMQTIAAQ